MWPVSKQVTDSGRGEPPKKFELQIQILWREVCIGDVGFVLSIFVGGRFLYGPY
jgi:hypothetical protein